MYQLILTIQCVSIIVLFVECWVVFKNWKNILHGYLFLSCAATLVNSMGYLLELTALTEDAYFTALRLSYIGRVWTPFALLLFVMELIRVRVPRPLKAVLALFSVSTYVAVLTTKYTGLYYQTKTSFSRVGEFRVFHHVNGVWHHVYTVVLALYTIATLYLLISAIRRERSRHIGAASDRYTAGLSCSGLPLLLPRASPHSELGIAYTAWFVLSYS